MKQGKVPVHRTKVILILCLAVTFILVGWQQFYMREDTSQKKEAISEGTAEFTKVAKTADQFVAKTGLDWGRSVSIEWQNLHGRYLVIYPTPESEKTILGSRAVHVDGDGKAWLTPRG